MDVSLKGGRGRFRKRLLCSNAFGGVSSVFWGDSGRAHRWYSGPRGAQVPLNVEILLRVRRYRRLRRGEHIMALRQHNEMVPARGCRAPRGCGDGRPFGTE